MSPRGTSTTTASRTSSWTIQATARAATQGRAAPGTVPATTPPYPAHETQSGKTTGAAVWLQGPAIAMRAPASARTPAVQAADDGTTAYDTRGKVALARC